jgi:2-polyprenyl-3-methyl-5-hydroxy-6-metoxy-1,4-benzoquinol methylase
MAGITSPVPDLSGFGVVDLACGYGWFCRWAHEQRAARVLGVDASEKMLAQAKPLTPEAGIILCRRRSGTV